MNLNIWEGLLNLGSGLFSVVNFSWGEGGGWGRVLLSEFYGIRCERLTIIASCLSISYKAKYL